MTTVAYRSIVFPVEHRALVSTLAATAGDGVRISILGSERSFGVQPVESLVGYQADTAAGPLEGVVTLRELEEGWAVSDYSYRFTDPPQGATEELEALTRQLNEQLVERARRLDSPDAPIVEDPTAEEPTAEATTPSPR